MASLTPDIQDICSCCHQPIYKSAADKPLLVVGRMTLNPAFRLCQIDGERLHVTGREFDVLYLLAQRAGKVVSKETIFAVIWGFESEIEMKIIDVVACKLRKKIREIAGGDGIIQTHWGRGYSIGVDNSG